MHLLNIYSTTDMSLQSVQECDQLHIQHKSNSCTSFDPSQCRARLCNHEELRLQSDKYEQFFFVLGGCQHAKQKDVLVARYFFTNLMLNCHDALRHKYTKVIFIAAHASLRVSISAIFISGLDSSGPSL